MRIQRDETGAAAVEFAIVLILLMVLLFGIIEFGLGFYQSQGANAAVREAARRAAVGQITSCNNAALSAKYTDLTQIVNNSTNGVQHAAPTLTVSDDNANGVFGDPGDTVVIKVGYTVDLGALAGFIPGIPTTLSNTASAQTRVENQNTAPASVTSC